MGIAFLGTSVEIKYIDNGVEGDEGLDGESEENEVNFISHESFEEKVKVRDHAEGEPSGEGVSIDDHVVRDLTEENVKDRSGVEELWATLMEHGTGGEDIMGEVGPMEQPSTDVFMETRFNQVDNMLCEQSLIVKFVDQLDKKVKKFTDVLTKSAGDASYDLNLLYRDMETMLISAQDLVEKTNQPKKVVSDFMEQFDALLGKYEEQLRQMEMHKKWKRAWKPGHIDLDRP
ncbi:hypothetical protein Syun_002056 [Stephania yunnanensis]|uniref:Uncharacterized protein n=1 Tax=Stephania yunnanensis TaxID=152371 RepID=A0AAP0QBH6_9MAGN